MSTPRFDLGQTVRDRHTGYTGVITSRTEYLSALPRYGVERSTEHGLTVEFFDVGRLVAV